MISKSADVRNVPTHGVILIEKHIPNINDLKKFKFLTFVVILGNLEKIFISNSPIYPYS